MNDVGKSFQDTDINDAMVVICSSGAANTFYSFE